jgi:hypothetical protein
LDARGEVQQRIDIAVDEGQGCDLLGADGLADTRVSGVHAGCATFDENFAGGFAYLHVDIDTGELPDGECDAGLYGVPEAGARDLNLVIAGGKKIDVIFAEAGGLSVAEESGIEVTRGDLRAGNHGSLRTENGAENVTGDLLRKRWGPRDLPLRREAEGCELNGVML